MLLSGNPPQEAPSGWLAAASVLLLLVGSIDDARWLLKLMPTECHLSGQCSLNEPNRTAARRESVSERQFDGQFPWHPLTRIGLGFKRRGAEFRECPGNRLFICPRNPARQFRRRDCGARAVFATEHACQQRGDPPSLAGGVG